MNPALSYLYKCQQRHFEFVQDPCPNRNRATSYFAVCDKNCNDIKCALTDYKSGATTWKSIQGLQDRKINLCWFYIYIYCVIYGNITILNDCHNYCFHPCLTVWCGFNIIDVFLAVNDIWSLFFKWANYASFQILMHFHLIYRSIEYDVKPS
jgi:hypothetical protein